MSHKPLFGYIASQVDDGATALTRACAMFSPFIQRARNAPQR